MGKWYRVTKKIGRRLYDYWQRTERRGKSTKTFNKYIGPSGSSVAVGATRAPDENYQYTPEQIAGIKELGRIMDLPDDPLPANFSSLTWDDKVAALRPLNRYPVPSNNLATGEKILLRSTNLPNNYVVDVIKEEKLPDGTSYRYVDFDEPKPTVTQYGRTVAEHRDLLERADYTPPPAEPPEPEPEYTREGRREIRALEREQKQEEEAYKKRHSSEVRAAKRKSRGTGAANPFLGQAIRKKLNDSNE